MAKGSGETCAGAPTGLLAVIDPAGGAERRLRRMLPDCTEAVYASRATDRLAVARRTDLPTITARADGDRDTILLGHAAVDGMADEDVPAHLASLATAGRSEAMAAVQGAFGLVHVDWAADEVRVVSDLCGVRPLYRAEQGGAVAISDRALPAARIGEPRVLPRSAAAWLVFGYPTADETMFAGVTRVPPAGFGVISARGETWQCYWEPVAAEDPIDSTRLREELYDAFSGSMNRLVSNTDAAVVLLSGGFDSRLIALTGRLLGPDLTLVTVPYSGAERQVVDRLVPLLDLPCERIEVAGSILDAFDSMWHAHPDGFVIERNLTDLAVVPHAGPTPFLEGFLGGAVMGRQYHTYPDGGGSGRGAVLDWVCDVYADRTYEAVLAPTVAARVRQWAREAAEQQATALPEGTKPGWTWHLCTRQRRLYSNNFIQNAHRARFLHPFYDRALIERRLRHPTALFTGKLYHALLAERFGEAGALPHAGDLPAGRDIHDRYCRRLRAGLPRLARFVMRRPHLFRRSWTLNRLSAYGLGRRRQQYVAQFVARLAAFTDGPAGQGVGGDLQDVLCEAPS